MDDSILTASRILIVDDQPSNVMLLEGILQEEDFTSYRSITNSREVLPAFIDYLPDLILLKPGKLSPEEFENIKAHARLGAQMLSGGRFPLLQMDETLDEIKSQSGRQFDPQVADAFLKTVDA